MRANPPFFVTVLFVFFLSSAKFHSSPSSLSRCYDFCTATTQFGTLNVIPLSFWLTSSQSSIRHIQSSSFVILLGLLLSGDIHLNPGPISPTFNVCTLNIRSLLNPLKYTAIADLAETRTIDVFALTEAWITPSATSAELRNATPPGFFLISNPRTAPATHAHVVGGALPFFCVIHPSLSSHLHVLFSSLSNCSLLPSNLSILI
jgi:hypothetical protein